jgi:hypothetical protein
MGNQCGEKGPIKESHPLIMRSTTVILQATRKSLAEGKLWNEGPGRESKQLFLLYRNDAIDVHATETLGFTSRPKYLHSLDFLVRPQPEG